MRIAQELGIQLVATNDAHYLSKQDVEAHDALLCVLTGKLISDESGFVTPARNTSRPKRRWATLR